MTNLYVLGPPRAEIPCVRNSCTVCCHDTNMPLTLADIERLTSLGYRLNEFSLQDAEGYLRLRNRPDHACFFLDASGHCSIHAAKPEGCRVYPFIYDEDADKVIRDDVCPYAAQFVPPPETERKVRELVGRLEREADVRLKAERR